MMDTSNMIFFFFFLLLYSLLATCLKGVVTCLHAFSTKTEIVFRELD